MLLLSIILSVFASLFQATDLSVFLLFYNAIERLDVLFCTLAFNSRNCCVTFYGDDELATEFSLTPEATKTLFGSKKFCFFWPLIDDRFD
jgi:hypothetical protein